MKILLCDELVQHLEGSAYDRFPVRLDRIQSGTPFVGIVDGYNSREHCVILSESGHTYPLQSVFNRSTDYRWTNSSSYTIQGLKEVLLTARKRNR